jgi:hypothetical protein
MIFVEVNNGLGFQQQWTTSVPIAVCYATCSFEAKFSLTDKRQLNKSGNLSTIPFQAASECTTTNCTKMDFVHFFL